MNLRTAKRHTKLGSYRSRRYAESQLGLARYYAKNPHVLRRKIEQAERVKFWGCRYTITPRLVHEVFGDGRKLVGLSPMNMRPNYWVIRIDSGTDLESDEWYDTLDEIYESIALQFGTTDFECDDCGESGLSDSDCHCQEYRWFPAIDFKGSCWFAMEWPT